MLYLSPIRLCRLRSGHTAVTAGVTSLLLMLSCSEDHGLESKDMAPPARIHNLQCVAVDSTGVLLSWTAPGSDGSTGTPAAYDIRYSTSQIDTSIWNSASQVSNEPAPLPGRLTQTFRVTGLNASTVYYFAMKAADSASRWSELSNVAIGDVTRPVVSFSPITIDEISGLLTVPAIASDNHIVQRVEFYVDRCLRCVDTLAPWICSWDFAGIGDGSSHTIRITAYDAAGNESMPAQNTVLLHSTYIDHEPPVISSITFHSMPPSIQITLAKDRSGIDWDSFFVDVYVPTSEFEDFLPATRLLHTWIPDDFVPSEAACDGPEATAILRLDNMISGLPFGQLLKVVVYGGIRNRGFAETCSCEVYTYDFVKGGVRDLVGNHTEVVEEILTVYPPPY